MLACNLVVLQLKEKEEEGEWKECFALFECFFFGSIFWNVVGTSLITPILLLLFLDNLLLMQNSSRRKEEREKNGDMSKLGFAIYFIPFETSFSNFSIIFITIFK